MAFRKAIAGRIRAGNKVGHAGFGASMGGRVRRWAGTIPTAYWRVAGIAADATTLPDVSKAAHKLDGTLAGTVDQTGADATWNSTSIPPGSYQSLRFNGTDNKVTIPYNVVLKPDNSIKKMSVSLWIKTDQNSDYLMVTEEDAGSPTTGWFYAAIGVGTTNKANVYWNTAGNPGWKASTTSVQDDNWHHIVHVYNGDETNEISIYVDGVLETESATQSGNFVLNNVPVLLGYRRHSGANYYKYFMDEIAYWTDIALTAEQVRDLYNNGTVLNSYAGILRG